MQKLILFLFITAIACGSKTGDPKETGNDSTSKKQEVKEEPIEMDGDCPAKTMIQNFLATYPLLKHLNRYDISKANYAGAAIDGGIVNIIITNNSKMSVKEMTAFGEVLKLSADDFLLELTLNNMGAADRKIVTGDYLANQEPGNMSMFIEVKTMGEDGKVKHSPLYMTKGKVTITSVTETEICGTFELGGETETAKGAFKAPMIQREY